VIKIRAMKKFLAPAVAFLLAATLTFTLLPTLASRITTGLRFESEIIKVDVQKNGFAVKAYYFYRNPLPFAIERDLAIPFPSESNHHPPEKISLFSLGQEASIVSRNSVAADEKALPPDRILADDLQSLHPMPPENNPRKEALFFRDGGYFSSIYMEPGERRVLVLEYFQEVRDKRGTYIITSTAAWDRPLEWADYYITGHGVEITSSNYPLRPIKTGSNYCFCRTDFMPREDWHFRWK
jgi:hypothetical protein